MRDKTNVASEEKCNASEKSNLCKICAYMKDVEGRGVFKLNGDACKFLDISDLEENITSSVRWEIASRLEEAISKGLLDISVNYIMPDKLAWDIAYNSLYEPESRLEDIAIYTSDKQKILYYKDNNNYRLPEFDTGKRDLIEIMTELMDSVFGMDKNSYSHCISEVDLLYEKIQILFNDNYNGELINSNYEWKDIIEMPKNLRVPFSNCDLSEHFKKIEYAAE